MLATESTTTDAWSRNHGDMHISPAVRTERFIVFFSNENTHTDVHKSTGKISMKSDLF